MSEHEPRVSISTSSVDTDPSATERTLQDRAEQRRRDGLRSWIIRKRRSDARRDLPSSQDQLDSILSV